MVGLKTTRNLNRVQVISLWQSWKLPAAKFIFAMPKAFNFLTPSKPSSVRLEAPLIVIIAGSRTIINGMEALTAAVELSGFDITEVVSGGAAGIDRLGEQWAHAFRVPVATFPADWQTHGKAAGPIRNKQMAEYADALIAIWDGKSHGTANMIQEAKKRGLPVHIHQI